MNRIKYDYRLIFFSIAAATTLAVADADAHIKNEATQFPDIEFADARFDIVVLVGAGIIPETPVFEPDAPFTRADLAVWAALAADLGTGGETPDTDALGKAALEEGLIESVKGQATYEEINNVFFGGHLTLEQPAAKPTRGQAATFIASHLDTAAGTALLARRAVRQGPAGHPARVELRRNPDGGNTYIITIGDTSLPMFAHGRVANGPTDLVQWDGRTVRRSFIRERGGLAYWIYLEAEPIKTAELASNPVATADSDTPVTTRNRNLLYGLILAASCLGLVLFFQRRRSL